MDDTQRRVDAIRKDRSELENHIIDEYSAGKITRREFVRRGTVVGMSIPLVSFLAAACGGGSGGETTGGGTTPTATGAVQAGGNIRVAIIQPATEPNPIIVKDEGGAGLLGSTGEFLSFSNAKLELVADTSPKAGLRTRTERSGRSRFARASPSTAARR